MATLMMTTPQKGNPMVMMLDDLDENDGLEFANKRAMSDYLDEAAAGSPMSLSSTNRNQGFGLCNTRSQLLKVNAIYDAEEEEQSSVNQSLDHSRDYSRDEESEYYLKACMSKESRNSMSPLYAPSSDASDASSTASSSCTKESEENETDFLTEARASLRELQDWQDTGTFRSHDEDDDVSNCDASCNSSYDGNIDINRSFDAQSAFGFDDLYVSPHSSLDTPRSCPDLHALTKPQQTRPSSTKSWLKEIKEEEFEQRKRIAEAIAANSAQVSRRSFTPKSVLRTPKFFRNLESIGSDSKHNSDVSKDRSKTGRSKFMRSIRSLHTPTSFARRHRRSGHERDFEQRDDNNDLTSPTVSSTNGSQESSPTVGSHHNDKEIQVRRAFFGSARVVTMDGIVESFADDSAIVSPKVLEHTPASKRMEFAPTSDGPLTWV